ncbi:MAG: serine/threonine protein kinase [Planctomycetaceae bacterium]|nr:serine/threonine protein kinase [Planctomycetaceae bacterium]
MKDIVGANQESAVRSGGESGSFWSRGLLRRQIWIWPIVAALALAILGYLIRSSVESAMKASLAAQLQTLLKADVAALRIWMKLQESNARTVAGDRDLRVFVDEIVDLGNSPEGTDAALLRAPHLEKLREEIQPWLDAHHYQEFRLVSADGRILASSRDELVGKDGLQNGGKFLATVLSGHATVSPPLASRVMLRDSDGALRVGVPTMFAAAPVVDDEQRVVAALCLRLSPEQDFTRILQVARIGETGETYAFDAQGLMLSESLFTEDLVEMGLIAGRPIARSTLNLELRDPQVDLTTGARAPLPTGKQPLTRMAQSATAGQSGFDVDGYRDYRGVMVVGAWTWLDDYQYGVVNEVDMSEAYRPLAILRTAFRGLFGMLLLSSAGLFIFSIVVARLQRAARQSAQQLRQLGQYVLDEKIGEGGMGVVYRGHHAMLRRPTAIKLLSDRRNSEAAIRRFEREVRLTCQLNNPHTIVIFDYGRTPEGTFYYAMEYLDGLSLQQLVERYGPQEEGRVARILEQVCSSLAEAHATGLVHRDIKPANILVNERGGLFDFVKVLDFGLVRSTDEKEMTLTADGSLTGTPLYMSPESIERPRDVDARSDLYAVGAVGYFLLTGQPVFVGESVLKVCMQHISARPVRPSERAGRPISTRMEDLLLRSLAKQPADRPATAQELAVELAACAAAATWTEADTEYWWREKSPTKTGPFVSPPDSATATNELIGTIIVEKQDEGG